MREATETVSSPIHEYLEVGENMRQFGNVRFAQMTLFAAITAGILAVVFQDQPSVTDTARLALKVIGLLIVMVFWLMDQRAMEYWHHFRQRGIELEKDLGFKQYSSLPGNALISATNAIRILYLGICLLWVLTILWHEQ